MVLTDAPAGAPPDGVEVRRARTPEERFEAERIAAIGFGEPVTPTPDTVPPLDPDDRKVVYLAYVDGVPVARASASFSEYGVTLFGGATLPEARGRGAYRALVAARWEDAVARGTPVLVTQAGAMSRSILASLGFREVCQIRILVDLFDGVEV
jgi:GNAT superfamily N-acetyltransferase